ncbi:MAG TPA: ATP-binding protein [Anaerolineae bacterium]|nr:ATP-binding protein [Anaerolineae bacterium]HQI84555.1 ATP-binding protein [Anaerolineae bacterium]
MQIETYLAPAVLANKNSIAYTIRIISVILMLAAVLAGVVTAFDHNWAAVRALGILILPLLITFWLSSKGQAVTAIFVLAVSLLVLATILSTLGQGIHDVTNFVYPGILLVSSLVLNKRAFLVLVVLTLLAIAWLVLGAMFGLFVPRTPDVGALSDLLVVSVILIATASCVYLLSNNLQQSLSQVNKQMLERQQVEHALRESQTLLRLIFDHVFDGISVYEEYPERGDRRLIDCNARYAEIAGRSKEELLAMGNTLPVQKDVSGLTSRSEFLQRLNQGVYMGQFSWLRPDGRDNIVEYAAVPLHTADRFLVIGVDHDITAQVRATQEREAMIKALEAKNSELERFTYTVSHDLKSPLITINGFVGFLVQDAMAGNVARVKEDAAYINAAVAKMQHLLSELLELSRIGRLMNPPAETSFQSIVQEAVELVHGRIVERGVEVEIVPGLPTVYGDRARLVEVVQNLLDNACKFMGDQSQPRIEIGIRQTGKEPVFYVRDNGIGIEPQYQDQVFELFNKLNSTSEGTGVGLALAKRIIETHGGKIWVESAGPGCGSTFCFTLPGTNRET